VPSEIRGRFLEQRDDLHACFMPSFSE
jgi:hypothetical protein